MKKLFIHMPAYDRSDAIRTKMRFKLRYRAEGGDMSGKQSEKSDVNPDPDILSSVNFAIQLSKNTEENRHCYHCLSKP